MKGFIEVTTITTKYSINVNNILSFGDKWILLVSREYPDGIEESYEEIEELIKNSQ